MAFSGASLVQSLLGQLYGADRRRRAAAASTLLAVPAFAMLAASSGCGSGSSAFRGGAADTAFVGVAVGLTNVERYVDVYTGVQLALDQLNKSRTGKTPVLAMLRAPTTAKTAIAIAVSFRDNPRVIGVVGHTESNPTIAAAAIYGDRAGNGKKALMAITPTAGAGAVTKASEWVFRASPTMAEQGRAVARFADESLHLKRMGALYRNEAAGKEASRAFIEEFTKRGGTVVERDPFTEEISDFDAYGRRLVKRGVDGVIVGAGNAPEERAIIRSLRAAGGNAIVIGWNPPEGHDSTTLHDFRGMRYIMLYSATDSPTAEGAQFAQTFRALTGKTPDKWGATGYDSAMLIGLAVHAVGPHRAKIRDWMAGVGREHSPYAGATGRIAFNEQRDPINKRISIGEVGR